jgi:hypothetical protein
VGQVRHFSTLFANTATGFRFTPPRGMQNETATGRAEIETRSVLGRATEELHLRLALTSGPDDTTPSWQSLTIETYPRQALERLDEISAEAKMSAWVVGTSNSLGKTSIRCPFRPDFRCVRDWRARGPIQKGAVIWTTISKAKLLSFVFVANSPQQLTALAESMKGLQFF